MCTTKSKANLNNDIHWVDKCRGCGAVTITFSDGAVNSMRPVDANKHFGHVHIDNKVGCCDYCVNKWGIDLCGCGSGEKVGKCDNGYSECRRKEPAQILHEKKEYALWQ